MPVRKGPWWYLSRTSEGLSYPIHCRVPVDGPGRTPDVPPMPDESSDAPPAPWPDEVVLWTRTGWPRERNTSPSGVLDVSPDHGLLAYATDTTGGERFTLRFKNLETDSLLPDLIPDVTYGSAWANDDATFFYVRADAANRPHQIWVHKLGTDPATDICVIEEPDERFFLEVRRTKDGSLIVAASHSKLSSEVQVLSADRPDESFRIVEVRRENVEYDVDHDHGVLLMLTNDQAPNFRIVGLPRRGFGIGETLGRGDRPPARCAPRGNRSLRRLPRLRGAPRRHAPDPPSQSRRPERTVDEMVGPFGGGMAGAGRRGPLGVVDRRESRTGLDDDALRVLVARSPREPFSTST